MEIQNIGRTDGRNSRSLGIRYFVMDHKVEEYGLNSEHLRTHYFKKWSQVICFLLSRD